MTDPDAETLIGSFGLTHQVIRMQTDGLSHKDSLLQPPFRGNCLNWVLGHILVGRNTALKLMQETLIWDEAETSRYRSGSEPITRDEQALPLDRLLVDLDRSQERITAALKCTTPEELATVVPFRGSRRSLGQALASQHWHETYHTGQLELLRQLAGTDDAIV
jgi:uncharacterized damage-inducible protein DinB